MAGTQAGGKAASQTNKKRYGADFYSRIGRKGGAVTGVEKGFRANRKLASIAGRKGGLISKRKKAV